MISKPTVLILGAGASKHLGYPTGQELVNGLLSFPGDGSPTDWPKIFQIPDANEFTKRLYRSQQTIDAFLELNPHLAPLGKFLLAYHLKQKENLERLAGRFLANGRNNGRNAVYVS